MRTTIAFATSNYSEFPLSKTGISKKIICLWSGLYLHRGITALGVRRLVSTPSQ